MRKISTIVSALLVSLLLSALPALSEESRIRNEQLIPKKDTCLLLAKNCQDNGYVIQQRIERLQGEISKGGMVYSNEELNILKKKLDDAYKAQDFLFNEGV